MQGPGLATRAFAALLQLFPRWFRDLYADDMRRDFERRSRTLGSMSGWAARVRFEARAIAAVPWQALRVRWESGPSPRDPYAARGSHLGRGGEMGEWIRDSRIAARSLARRRTLALGVTLTLGLGIGATTTIYGVVDGVMLRPLPYRDAASLALVGSIPPGTQERAGGGDLQELGMISLPNYLDFRERTRFFADLAAIEPNLTVLPDIGNGAELVGYANVTPGLLEMMGGTAAMGRLFLPDEYGAGSEQVLVLSYGAWQRYLGGDEAALGRPAERLGWDATVVGVLPPDFRPPEALFSGGDTPDLWSPLRTDVPNASQWYSRRRGRLHVLGHLESGTSVEQARVEAGRIAADLAASYPQDNIESDGSRVGIGVNGLHAQTVGATASGLGLFLGAAGLLLLLAVMNAATLLSARALDRAREFGIRMALGSGRARVVRLLMTEAGILSLLGGAIGVGLAYGGVASFLRYAPSSIPRLDGVAVDARVLAVAALVSLCVGVAAGLVPAFRLTRAFSWEGARHAGRTFSEPASRFRDALVSGQMAVAVVLLSGAALLFSSFMRIRSVDPGFLPDDLVAMPVAAKGGAGWDFQAPWVSWDRLLDALRAVPGVESVALASNIPFEAPSWSPRLLLPGDGPETVREGIAGYVITPGYLETVGTALLGGRDVQPLDGPDAERVALVNESFVRTQLGGVDPIGMTVRWAAGTEWSPGDEWIPPPEWLDGGTTPLRIVGLVEDAVQASVEDGPRPAIYVPYTQGRGGPTAVIRTSLPTESIFPSLRRAAAHFNPMVPPFDAGVLQERIGVARTLPRFQTVLITAFALTALLLAAAGLYGSVAYSVGRRRREIGVRMALGAGRTGILGMVLGQGMRLAITGLVVGMIAAIFLARLLTGMLYGVEPHDPVTLLLAGSVLVLVSAAACLVPARRATTVDPASAVKEE